MSDFMKTVLLWSAILLLISYMFRINLVNVVSDIVHAAQTVHNSIGHL
jgi:hypothetical protein